MKTLKTIALVSIVSIGMTSSVFASWWNPTTWKVFKKESKVISQERSNVINVSTTTFNESTKNSLISCNGSKYNKCPEGQNFVCPTNGEDAFCEKTKKEEIKTPKIVEKHVAPDTVKGVIPKQKSATQVNTENFNFLVVELNDSLVSSFEKHLALHVELRDIFKERQQKSLQLQNYFNNLVVQSVPKGVNIPNDLYREMAIMEGVDADLARLSMAKEDILIKAQNEIITKFKEFRTIELTKFYTKEQAITKMKEMMKSYDAMDLFSQKLREEYDYYIKFSERTDSQISQSVNALKKNSDEYTYAKSIPKEVYVPIQQITIPKIEFPKTTYCHTSYTGIRGNYDVTCNTR